ncbi:hypothetical protein [Bremerella cremea]|uniref:hypothetical protein n=1 Tax=Bremerella cremea TaxID=1031537 RepID=UPI0031E4EEB8
MSAEPSPFDRKLAHRQFSAEAFNTAWELIDKTDRDLEEDIDMLCHAAASMWHWRHREDLTDQSRSVGYWQLSRVFALLSDGPMAKQCGQLCLKYARGTPPFYQAYAYEALARAAAICGEMTAANRHLDSAEQLARQVGEASSREMLLADLQSIRG